MNKTDVIEIIDVLAERMGTTVGQLVEIYASHVQIEAWVAITAWTIIPILVSTAGFELFRRNPENEDRRILGAIGMIIPMAILAGVWFSYLPDIIVPEKPALTNIAADFVKFR